MPFKEAIEHFNSRAFKIAEDVEADLLQGMKKRVSQAIDDGTTLEEFRVSVDQMFDKAGYTQLAAYRVAAIYRNNLATAYQAGRYRQMTDPDVMEALPLWRYVAVMDGRTRPSHFAMHGRVFPADSPIWDEWYPPCGFNCRCDVMAVSRARAEHEGWNVEKKLAKTFEWPDEETNKKTRLPLVPDKGWNVLPTLKYAEAA